MIWFITFLSLIGVVLNIYERRECFYIWAVTNFCWMIIDYRAGLLAQAVLFTVYLVLALWGIYKWRHKR